MLENRPLVSSDYTGVEQSCIVDQRRTKIVGDRFIKIVSWYDNEWGYSSRVLICQACCVMTSEKSIWSDMHVRRHQHGGTF